MLTPEQKKQYSDIIEELGKVLDISESQYDSAVKSYMHVAQWLAHEESPLAKYSPEILPQGSFLLQTMIKPVLEDDELDVDLVCKLEKIEPGLTQYTLKKMVGDRLASNAILEKLLHHPDGRRCWRLQYAESTKFHLDVLPAVVVSGYQPILEKALALSDLQDVEKLGVRITDKQAVDYKTSTNLQEWLKSNPFGYAIWFQNRAKPSGSAIRILSESIQSLPTFQHSKTPLQRVVQILKRHRDIRFNGDEDKPISIIITTLAAKAYNGESSLVDALINVVEKMANFIEPYYSMEHGKWIKKVSNPINEQENFADKWVQYPEREEKFLIWLDEVKKDLNGIFGQRGKGIPAINEAMSKAFGKDTVNKTIKNYGDKLLNIRESSSLKMAAVTGMLGTEGRTIVPQHKPYGKYE